MSTVITPFQGTDSFSTATFNNRISQINTGFSYISNPNLLDNWYFGNPVNQRGQTSYTGTGYTIDRWMNEHSDKVVVTLENGLLKLTFSGVTTYMQKVQVPVGIQVTCSVLVENIDGDIKLLWQDTDNYADTHELHLSHGMNTLTITTTKQNYRFAIYSSDSNVKTISIKAAKLELGSQQTLAHQENGVWVLNEIPDYGEQLARCQRYFQRIVVPVATNFIPVKDNLIQYQCNLPVQMRAEPSVTCGTFFVVNRNNNSAVFSENFVTPIKQSASVNSVVISIEKTQSNPVPVGKSGGVYVGSYYDDSGTRTIDCTADL